MLKYVKTNLDIYKETGIFPSTQRVVPTFDADLLVGELSFHNISEEEETTALTTGVFDTTNRVHPDYFGYSSDAPVLGYNNESLLSKGFAELKLPQKVDLVNCFIGGGPYFDGTFGQGIFVMTGNYVDNEFVPNVVYLIRGTNSGIRLLVYVKTGLGMEIVDSETSTQIIGGSNTSYYSGQGGVRQEQFYNPAFWGLGTSGYDTNIIQIGCPASWLNMEGFEGYKEGVSFDIVRYFPIEVSSYASTMYTSQMIVYNDTTSQSIIPDIMPPKVTITLTSSEIIDVKYFTPLYMTGVTSGQIIGQHPVNKSGTTVEVECYPYSAIVYTKGDTEHVINYTDTTESKTINVF